MEILLLATATKTETQAVLSVFEKATKRKKELLRIDHKTYYKIGMLGETEISVVQSEAGTATPGGSLPTLLKAISAINASAVIMVGVAFGAKPDKQKIGDILVSQFMMAYEPERKMEASIDRGVRVNASSSLLDITRAAELEWHGPNVHVGLMLSGEKLVDDMEFTEALKLREPEAIGGEMEGNGLYIAADEKKIDWIVVKGICDWADGNKSNKYQPLAAKNAARFVLAMVYKLSPTYINGETRVTFTQKNKTEDYAISYGSIAQIKSIVLEMDKTLSSVDKFYPDQCDEALANISKIKAYLNYHWAAAPSEYATLANSDYIEALIDSAQTSLRSLRESHSSGQSKHRKDLQNLLKEVIDNLPTPL